MRMDLDHPDFDVTAPPLLRTLFAEILFQVLGVVLTLLFLLLDDRAEDFLKRHYDRRHIWGGTTTCRSWRGHGSRESCGRHRSWRCGRSWSWRSDHRRWCGRNGRWYGEPTCQERLLGPISASCRVSEFGRAVRESRRGVSQLGLSVDALVHNLLQSNDADGARGTHLTG